MEMVGHHYETPDDSVGVMLTYFFDGPAQIFSCYSICYFTVANASEIMSSAACADCNEICAVTVVMPIRPRIFPIHSGWSALERVEEGDQALEFGVVGEAEGYLSASFFVEREVDGGLESLREMFAQNVEVG